MVQQMDVFLQAETISFIDILFKVVESKVGGNDAIFNDPDADPAVKRYNFVCMDTEKTNTVPTCELLLRRA